jgi:hypothetical protein
MCRFTIRDVLWLTVVVAALTCWYIDRREFAARVTAVKTKLAATDADLKATTQKLKTATQGISTLQSDARRLRTKLAGHVDVRPNRITQPETAQRCSIRGQACSCFSAAPEASYLASHSWRRGGGLEQTIKPAAVFSCAGG